jgi:hypothetical protein
MRIASVCLLIALAASTAAHAAPCKTKGAADAKELKLDLKNKDVLAGLKVSFQLGLLPAEFPHKDIDAGTNACTRGTFPSGTAKLELHGENDKSPARWTRPAPGAPTLFVAIMPKPEPARLWEKNGGQTTFAVGDWMYAVVFAVGTDKRLAFHFFDKIPTDAKLKSLLQPIAEGKARWQAAFDTTKRITVVNPKQP